MLPLKTLGEDPFQASLLTSGAALACGGITPVFTCYSLLVNLSQMPLV